MSSSSPYLQQNHQPVESASTLNNSMANYGSSNSIHHNQSSSNNNSSHHYNPDDYDDETGDNSYLESTIALKRQGSTINIKHAPHPWKKHRFCRFCFPNCRNIVLWLSLFSLLAGIIGFAVGPQLVVDVIRSKTALSSPYSPIFKFWTDPDSYGVKTYRKLYLYNITNPYEIVEKGEQPNIVQIGPFVYREVWKKDPSSVRWFINGTVGYKYKYFLFFEPDLSIDEVTGKKHTSDSNFNVTILNGPMRGTLYRVGRIPDTIVHITNKFNITRQEVCLLLDNLINNTIVGPKGIFTRRSPLEVFFGYIDPIWKELHEPLLDFNYNASTFFQAQWNGSAVVPSPYTWRSGMMCPLWQNPEQCNNTGADVTLAVSGKDDYKLLDSDVQQREKEDLWNAQGLPQWMRRDLLSPGGATADITTWAGQLQGQWWWGPMREGIDGGNQPRPDALNPPHDEYNFDSNNNDNAAAEEETEVVMMTKQSNNVQEVQGKKKMKTQLSSSASPSPLPFDDEACRRQYGSDGTRFPIPIKNDDILQIFSDFMGRTFPFTYTGETSYSDLNTKRFSFNFEHGLRASAINRHCYQMRMDGLINVSQFVFGDGLVTKAGYLDSCVTQNEDMVCRDEEWPNIEEMTKQQQGNWSGGDDDGFCGPILPFNNTFSATYEDSILQHNNKNNEGRLTYDQFLNKHILKINSPAPRKTQEFRDHYDTFVDVLSLTGTTLNARASGQISLPLGPIFVRGCEGNISNPGLSHLVGNFTTTYLANFTNGMPRTMVPYMRLDRTAQIGGEVMKELKENLTLVKVAYALCGVAIGLGVLGLVGIVMFQFRLGCFRNRVTASDSDEE